MTTIAPVLYKIRASAIHSRYGQSAARSSGRGAAILRRFGALYGGQIREMVIRRAGGGQIAVPEGGPAIARHLRCYSRGGYYLRQLISI